MADDLRRFVTDLRALRESRGVSLQRIQGDTRIPIDVLRQFEETGLEGNRTFNRVYLRSLVRVYSQSIGVAVEPVMQGLDAAFEQRYSGLGVEASAPPEPSSEPPAASGSSDVPARRGGRRKAVVPEPEPVEPDEPDMTPEPEEGAESDGRRVVEAPSNAYDGGPLFDTVPERPGLPAWAYGLIVLVVLGAVAGGVLWWMGRQPASPLASDDPAMEDTTGAPQDSAATPAPALPATLPAEIRLTVTATGAPLAPVRVLVDQDARRPYWIEVDSSRVFTFKDSVFVSDLTPTAALQVEGVPVDAALRQPDGSYRIRRADLQR